jgi:DNA polymerase-1
LQPLAAELRARLERLALQPLFNDVEMPLVRVLAAMERRGMLVDVDHLRALGREFGDRMDALMNEIYALAGEPFNINSPPQLRTVLFEKLSLSRRGVRRGKTGFSTDVDVLTRLAQEHPLPAKILDYRALAKLKSTSTLPAAVNRRPAACIPASTRPAPPPGGSAPANPTCRTSPHAARRGGASAPRSSRRRAPC